MAELVMRKLHSGDRESVHHALEKIAGLCKTTVPNADKNKHDFVLAGGYGTVILVMEAWHRHVGIQTQGLRVLCNVSCTSHADIVPSNIGAIEIVVASLRRYHNEVAVLECGIVALNNLCHCSPTDIERLLAVNGMQCVVKAMTQYPSQVKIQKWGTRLLAKVVHCQCPHDLMEAGAVQVLAHVVQHYHEDRSVRNEARLAILKLLRNEL